MMPRSCKHNSESDNIYNIWTADKNTKLYKNEMLRNKHLLKLFPISSGTVIDIGCGTGYMSYLLSEKNINTTSVDISEKRLSLFKDIASRKQIKQIHDDMFNLNLNNYDALISQEVIEHIEDYESALKKMNSFVKKGGYALFCVPYNENLEAKTKKCPMCGELYHIAGHLHSFTTEKLTRSISQAGFEIRKVQLIVNKRTFKWLAMLKIPVNQITLAFDRLMNFLFPHKAAYLAILGKRVD